jgi:hypothetical protein
MKNTSISQQAAANDFVPLVAPTIAGSSTDYAMMYDTVANPLVRRRVATLDTAQTLTGKTMSSASNTIDASALRTTPVAATAPTTGDMLGFNGTSWTPTTVTATAPIAFSGNNISAIVGTTAGTLAAGNDPRLIVPQRVVVKNSGAGSGEFTSIRAAILSITDASAIKPYLITVFPGVYAESPMTLPAWVWLSGAGSGAVIVVPTTVVSPLLTISANSSVESITFSGAGAGICILATSAVSCIIHRLVITNFAFPVKFISPSAPTSAIMYNCMIAAPFTTAITVDGTFLAGVYACNVILQANIIAGNGSSTSGIYLAGPYADLSVSGGRITGLTAGNAVVIEDTAVLIMQGVDVRLCNLGIVCNNVGGGPELKISAITMVDITTNTLVVSHPATAGIITGILGRSSVIIDPAANIAMNITDPINTGVAISGELYYNPIIGGVFTEIGEQFVDCAATGALRGGDVLSISGLDVTISAGTSYAIQGVHPNHELIKLEWPDTTITLPADAVSYVYVDATGVITSALSLPNTLANTPLVRIGTTASDVEFIDPQKYRAEHPMDRIIEMWREVIGARFASGGILTVNASRQIAVSSGEYYYSGNEILITGGSAPLAFTTYYHTAGAWTRTAAITVVQNSSYDDGTNVVALAAGQYVKHVFYTVGVGAHEQYFMIYGDAAFADLTSAIAGALTMPPNYFSEGIVPIAAVIVQQGNATFSQVIDLRPTVTGGASASGGASVHGNLIGLLSDDHPQYVLTNGGRALTGNLDLNSHAVTNATTVNGVTVEAHAARHLPNGADPLATAAPLTTLSGATINYVGTANSFARSDHTHAIDQTSLNINTIGGTLDVAKGGTGTTSLTSGNFLQGNGTGAVTATKAVPSGVVVGTTDTQTLTNKAISSTANTITITSGAISAQNINSVFNQFLNTTSSPTFAAASITGNLSADQLWGYTTQHDISCGDLRVTGSGGNAILGQTSRTVAVRSLLLTDFSTDNTQLNVLGLANDNTTVVKKTNIVDTSTAQTLTNKTLTTPIIAAILNPNDSNNQLNMPTVGATDEFVTKTATQRLTNKSLDAELSSLYADGDNTKTALFSLNPAATGTSSTLRFAQTANRVITFPDATTTLVGTDSAQTLTNKTINSASNTITITSGSLVAANINTVLNQPLLTTSSPTFNSLTLTGSTLGLAGGKVTLYTWTVTVTGTTPVTAITIPLATGTVALFESRALVNNTTDTRAGAYKISTHVYNLSGTAVVGGNIESTNNCETSGFRAGALDCVASGSNILVRYGAVAAKTHVVQGTTWVYSN